MCSQKLIFLPLKNWCIRRFFWVSYHKFTFYDVIIYFDVFYIFLEWGLAQVVVAAQRFEFFKVKVFCMSIFLTECVLENVFVS